MLRGCLVYVSGAITPTEEFPNLNQNIARFYTVSLDLFRLGFSVFCPVQQWLPEATGYGDVYDAIMEMDLEILSRCNAILMLEGWEKSRGAVAEYNFARASHLDVLFETEFFSTPLALQDVK